MEAIDFWLYHLRVSLWFVIPGWIIGVMSLARDIKLDLELRNSRRVKYVDKVGRVLFHLVLGLSLREWAWEEMINLINGINIFLGIVVGIGVYYSLRFFGLVFFAPLEPYKKGVLGTVENFFDGEPEIEIPDVETPIETAELL